MPKVQNTPTRARVRLGTRHETRRQTRQSCAVHTPQRRPTHRPTQHMRRDSRPDTRRKCNIYEKDCVAYRARVHRRDVSTRQRLGFDVVTCAEMCSSRLHNDAICIYYGILPVMGCPSSKSQRHGLRSPYA